MQPSANTTTFFIPPRSREVAASIYEVSENAPPQGKSPSGVIWTAHFNDTERRHTDVQRQGA
jgi:hypothetical protein